MKQVLFKHTSTPPTEAELIDGRLIDTPHNPRRACEGSEPAMLHTKQDTQVIELTTRDKNHTRRSANHDHPLREIVILQRMWPGVGLGSGAIVTLYTGIGAPR